MANSNLTNAKKAKNDEFYTQYQDIEKEINAYIEYNPDVFRGKTILLPCDDPEWSNFTKFFAQNFERFGLRKLISTSYARNSKENKDSIQLSFLEVNSPKYDKEKTDSRGKIYTLTNDKTGDGKINFEDFEWEYLEGDGDFRSEEVKALRDEADIIITNPPFSLFREFLAWIVEAKKQFVLIGHMNAIKYANIFPLIKENKMWLGATNFNVGMYFMVPEDFAYADTYKFERERNGVKVSRVPGVCWFTSFNHGKRHQPLPLMTEAEVIKFVTKKQYTKYDNYDAIEVSLVKNIPSDYRGMMGVPISFLDKYSPEQFEIIGLGQGNLYRELTPKGLSKEFVKNYYQNGGTGSISEDHPILGYYDENSKATIPYMRIIIKHKK